MVPWPGRPDSRPRRGLPLQGMLVLIAMATFSG